MERRPNRASFPFVYNYFYFNLFAYYFLLKNTKIDARTTVVVH